MSELRHQVEGFILAGGESTRMGRDKALLEVGGLPMLLRMAYLLEPLVAQVTVVGPPQRYASLGLACVPDEVEHLGPLGGILTALRTSDAAWNLIVGCDLPYLTPKWLAFLIRRALESEAAVVMPASRFGYEPLCAMYHVRCADTIAESVSRGVYKVTDGLGSLTMEILPPDLWRTFDSDGRLLKNMNRPEDFAEAREFFGAGTTH
jgi:molybdopterin-guanine dinucleotide biosynthesis protein A